MDREIVYKCIDSERDYQDSQNNNWEHKGYPSVEAELLLMEHYLHLTREKWVQTSDNEACLDMMRKVVGIGIRCFENHGCMPRISVTKK